MDKQMTAICSECKRKAAFTIEPRPVEELAAVTEYVVVCGDCGHAVHSCWMNKALEQLQKDAKATREPVRKAHLFRRYQRKFEEFQKVMARRVEDRAKSELMLSQWMRDNTTEGDWLAFDRVIAAKYLAQLNHRSDILPEQIERLRNAGPVQPGDEQAAEAIWARVPKGIKHLGDVE